MDKHEKVIKGLECIRDWAQFAVNKRWLVAGASEKTVKYAEDALELLGEYDDFCRFVTKEMFDRLNDCGNCDSAEVYLRKLQKLGYVRLERDVYSEVEDE